MSDEPDLFWALRTLRAFIESEIEARAVVGDDQAEYRDEPREAYAAFSLVRNVALRNAERGEASEEDARTFAEMADALGEIAYLVGSHGEEDISAIVRRTRDLVENYDKLIDLAGAPHVG